MTACTFQPDEFWKNWKGGVPVGTQLMEPKQAEYACTMTLGVLHYIDQVKKKIESGEASLELIEYSLENMRTTHEIFTGRLKGLRDDPEAKGDFGWAPEATRRQVHICKGHTADDLEGLLGRIQGEISIFETAQKEASRGFPYGKAAIAVGVLAVVGILAKTYLNP